MAIFPISSVLRRFTSPVFPNVVRQGLSSQKYKWLILDRPTKFSMDQKFAF